MNKPMNNMAGALIVFSVLLLSACGKKEAGSAAERAPLASDATISSAGAQSTLDPIISPDRDDASSATAVTSMEKNNSPVNEKSEKAGYPPTGTNQAVVGTNPAHQEELALAAKSGCMVCHKIDSKLVGPAWLDVSKRYKGDAGAKARLVAIVKAGGKGNWTDVTGGAAMPPNSPKVSDENIEKLVKFILSLS